MKYLEIVPLSFFLIYIRYIDMERGQDWNIPFLTSGLLAISATIFLITKKNYLIVSF